MSEPFKAAVVGPSRVGKTTLLTAILADTAELLAGTPVSVALDEATASRVRRQKGHLRSAIEAGEFDAAALGGTQAMSVYEIKLQADGDVGLEIPFRILDYPGGWLDPDMRARSPEAGKEWPSCEAHIKDSIMLLLPIDAAVLMEASTPAQRAAVPELLGLVDVEAVAERWAKIRNQHPAEPAVLLLAPLKCEKYFSDNGGAGQEAGRLRKLVREKYKEVLRIVAAECKDRMVHVVYAPIDTYGCVELMEAEWLRLGSGGLDFRGHYRFRGRPPTISVKAAGTIMQELCRAILDTEIGRTTESIDASLSAYTRLLERKAAPKGGFLNTLSYYLGNEVWENRAGRQRTQQEIARAQRQREQLREAVEKLVASPSDDRVEVW
ncbi:hypothetical protein ETD83_02395 [Actinomadura soli]|uniref:Uncharacterized protein n=1 Tax=Actinomadura soli TaxID=2508997 RepID=A0A5C4JJM2_9ACTN|nr:hypothetical protein [Actinomadura soli]TMR07009.1 hypothetical protein ETD83_02395 [Actinomadura soli]